ncbi:MAG TPA: FAD-binding protein [Nakamurella sp.]
MTGANEGLSVLVLEKTEFLGGTTAYSAGTCWIPNNRFQRAAGVTDDAQVAAGYLDRLAGDKAPRAVRESYLRHGSEAIDYFDGIGVKFWQSKTVVDYHPEVEGASLGGRTLEPQTRCARRPSERSSRRTWPTATCPRRCARTATSQRCCAVNWALNPARNWQPCCPRPGARAGAPTPQGPRLTRHLAGPVAGAEVRPRMSRSAGLRGRAGRD